MAKKCKTKKAMALGGDLNASPNRSYPYFLISATGQIKHYADGGSFDDTEVDPTADSETPKKGISDIFGSMGGGSMYSMIGTGISDAIGGNTNIAEDRTKGKDAGIASGVFSGAGQGASIGSAAGPWGAAAGAIIGGVVGGFTASDKKDKEIAALRDSMTAKYADLGPMTTQYLGAYGLDLDPNGDPTTPVTGTPVASTTGTPPATGTPAAPAPKALTLAELQAMDGSQLAKQNPNDIYNVQLQAHKDWSTGYRNPDEYNYQLSPAELQAYLTEKQKEDPNAFIHTGVPKSMYVYKDDKNQIDYSKYFPQYDKPTKPNAATLASWKPATAVVPPMEAKKEASYLDPHTGQPLDPKIYGRPTGEIDEQFAQGAELITRRLENVKAQNDQQAAMARNKELIGKMKPEDLEAAKAAKLTPYEWLKSQNRLGEFGLAYGGAVGDEMRFAGEATEYNGMRHEDGGISIGDKEVEDGEIRVGDYVFSDRLLNETGKTFAAEAKKITDRYAEYGNDAAAKRTQNKFLEELKYKNDQARLLKQKEDAEMRVALGQDFAAYGGMISQDDAGRYVVDKNNRMALMGAAKERKMSYSKYIDSLYKYGGDMVKDTMAYGGDDPNNPFGSMTGTGNYADILPTGTNMDNSIGMPVDFGAATSDMGGLVENNAGLVTGASTSPSGDLMSFFANTGVPTIDDPSNGGTANSSQAGEAAADDKNYWQKVKENFGKPEAGLLMSQLPAISNLIGNMKPVTSKFDRVNLDEVSLEAERQSLAKAVDRARRVQRENVRGTATSSGEALAALSAGNAGLTSREMDSLSEIMQREKNANIQINNQEKLTNLNISNQENLARQQDEAMKATVRSAALANMSENAQGYLKDKSLIEENQAANKRLLSLLDSGEYKIVTTEDGGYKVVYKNAKENTNKETK